MAGRGYRMPLSPQIKPILIWNCWCYKYGLIMRKTNRYSERLCDLDESELTYAQVTYPNGKGNRFKPWVFVGSTPTLGTIKN